MANTSKKSSRRLRIRRGIRKRVIGTAERPRLAVYRSNKEIYCQVINDEEGKTIVGASSRLKTIADDSSEKTKSEISKLVGQEIARRAKEAGIEHVVFDRGGFRYHGRVAALADGAREGGLNF